MPLDKTVLVTGASSGIGAAIARELGRAGARLALGARRTDRLDALAAEIGGDVLVRRLDVTDRADLAAFADAARARFGRVDVIVNNAGVMPLSPMASLKVEEWERMVDVNIKGVLWGVAAVLPEMTARGSGHIVNIASIGALRSCRRPPSTARRSTPCGRSPRACARRTSASASPASIRASSRASSPTPSPTRSPRPP